jgi:hypothetical protein
MILTKVFWLGWRLLMPILLWNYDVFSRSSMLELFTLFFLVELGTGYYLAFNFQVSHVSTVAEYPLGTKNEDVVPEEWAISQVKTSVDYAHGDMVTTFLAGALNYQIAHHLFPGISLPVPCHRPYHQGGVRRVRRQVHGAPFLHGCLPRPSAVPVRDGAAREGCECGDGLRQKGSLRERMMTKVLFLLLLLSPSVFLFSNVLIKATRLFLGLLPSELATKTTTKGQ